MGNRIIVDPNFCRSKRMPDGTYAPMVYRTGVVHKFLPVVDLGTFATAKEAREAAQVFRNEQIALARAGQPHRSV